MNGNGYTDKAITQTDDTLLGSSALHKVGRLGRSSISVFGRDVSRYARVRVGVLRDAIMFQDPTDSNNRFPKILRFHARST